MAEGKHRSIGGLIMLAAGIIAAILIVHIVLVLLGANSSNSIVSTDADWARHLGAWFDNLFTTSNGKWNTVLDYGLAALAYLAVGRLLEGFVERA